ncbi:MAG: galactokinase [Sphingobacteriales bacterium]|nr:galactokinase [Sphingobacteriales bacterium]
MQINKVAAGIAEKFRQAFNSEPLVVRSPGRVNLIGEHTDYNGGFVLPAAIDKAVYVALGKSNDDMCQFIAADMQEQYSGNINNLKKIERHWYDYINGVVDQLQKAGYTIPGFNCVIGGDIPTGAGMSSSAAVECAVLYALNETFHLKLDTLSMVKLAQKAENEYVGVQCGIMDQFASMFGKKGNVIKLDCRSLEFEYTPFVTDDIKIVLFDTNIKHSLASSEYNTRRLQCETGVAMIQEFHPQVKTLRDANMDMLTKYVLPKDKVVYDRCRYVVEEIQRLQAACIDLVHNDRVAFGKKMYATHEGLSKLYDVSCRELDFLVEFVKNEKAVLGARMMGGGFGGCTINLIKEGAIAEIAARIAKAYQDAFNMEMKMYVTQIEDGTNIINVHHYAAQL